MIVCFLFVNSTTEQLIFDVFDIYIYMYIVHRCRPNNVLAHFYAGTSSNSLRILAYCNKLLRNAPDRSEEKSLLLNKLVSSKNMKII